MRCNTVAVRCDLVDTPVKSAFRGFTFWLKTTTLIDPSQKRTSLNLAGAQPHRTPAADFAERHTRQPLPLARLPPRRREVEWLRLEGAHDVRLFDRSDGGSRPSRYRGRADRPGARGRLPREARDLSSRIPLVEGHEATRRHGPMSARTRRLSRARPDPYSIRRWMHSGICGSADR